MGKKMSKGKMNSSFVRNGRGGGVKKNLWTSFMKAPRSSFSRNCNRMEYILRTNDGPPFGGGGGAGWLVGMREGEREKA